MTITVECSLACMQGAWLVMVEMISHASISGFMKLMLLELHERKLHQIPPEGILPEQYYAVEYVENYYIGRALSQADSFVKFKFLHRVGVKSFDWPRWDDLDDVHISCVLWAPSPWRMLAHLLSKTAKH